MAGESAPRRRRLTGEDYSRLFGRIERAFDVEEITAEEIADYINAKTPGMFGLAEQIAQVKVISDDVGKIEDINELRILRKESLKLPVHQMIILNKIDEKIIALSITTTEEFAEERGIILTEDVKGNIEIWKDGIERMVIRENGHFKAWRRM